MSEDHHDSNNIPTIQGKCANCQGTFDLTKGLECPTCHAVNNLSSVWQTGIAPKFNHDEEVDTLMKLVDMSIARIREEASSETPKQRWDRIHSHMQKRTPIPHVLNTDGTACHSECDACAWETYNKSVDAEIQWLEDHVANVPSNDTRKGHET